MHGDPPPECGSPCPVGLRPAAIVRRLPDHAVTAVPAPTARRGCPTRCRLLSAERRPAVRVGGGAVTHSGRIGPYRVERLLGRGFVRDGLAGPRPGARRAGWRSRCWPRTGATTCGCGSASWTRPGCCAGSTHERLVRVHAVGELPDGRPYSVLAWADGGSLRDRLAAGPMPAPRRPGVAGRDRRRRRRPAPARRGAPRPDPGQRAVPLRPRTASGC